MVIKKVLHLFLTKRLNYMGKVEIGNEEKILESAQEVFLEKGFDGARMQQIADHAGINKALLHYYYRSKEKLFVMVLQAKLKVFLPRVGAIFYTEMPVAQKMDSLIDAYLDLLRKNPKLPLFILTSIHKYPNFVEHLPIGLYDIITKYFKKEVDKDTINDIDPFHFFISLLGMCIFPIIARPMSQKLFEKTNEEYDQFLIERGEVIKSYVKQILIKA